MTIVSQSWRVVNPVHDFASEEAKGVVRLMSQPVSLSQVLDRKARIDQAISTHDAALFAAHLQGWLEATAYLRALPNLRKLGLEPTEIPAFEAADLRDISVRKEADDAVMGFCIAAGLARDSLAFTTLDRLLTEHFGIIYPGSSALYHCNQIIDPIVTLDDAIGQIVKALFEGAVLPPARLWDAGLRLLQRLRSSSFETALTPLAAAWLRAEWTAVIAQPEVLARRDADLAKLRTCLDDSHDDQAFIAALLLAAAGVVDAPIAPDYLTQLAKLTQRG